MNPQSYQVPTLPLSAEDGGGFTGLVPAQPGCRSDGETPQAALANAYDAITCWMEAAEDTGRSIPQPRPMAA